MTKKLRENQNNLLIVVCDSVIPALLACSILALEKNADAGVLLIIEYTEQDGGEESFFRLVQFMFAEYIHGRKARVVRYYSSEESINPILKAIPWMNEVRSSSQDRIELLISSSSKLLPFWEGAFKTTILMHSVLSVTNLSRTRSKLANLKAQFVSSLYRLLINVLLTNFVSGNAIGIKKILSLGQRFPSRIATPFAISSIKSSYPVDFFSSIRRIQWKKFSSEIDSLLPVFLEENIQVIVILLVGDEPLKKRNNSYNLVKYIDCYRELFRDVDKLTDPGKRKFVIFKSHKRYSMLSQDEMDAMSDAASALGTAESEFLQGKNAEIPVECLPVRPWDIFVAEDSFALLTMSTKAQCFYADAYFSPFRLIEEQNRTDFNKKFAQRERLVVKSL